jgi:isopentenyl-diphosphate delta-isomerase type 1
MNDELLDIVDENNNPLGISKPRNVIHKEMKDWHRATSIWIINENKEVLCQKRSLEVEGCPGRWQSYLGGHLTSGESYEQNAVRELEEELSLKIKPVDLKFIEDRPSESGKTWLRIYVFYYKKVQKFSFQSKEVDELKWIDLPTLEEMFEKKIFCNRPNEKIFEILRNKNK